jgi:isopenicillin-N epimerase
MPAQGSGQGGRNLATTTRSHPEIRTQLIMSISRRQFFSRAGFMAMAGSGMAGSGLVGCDSDTNAPPLQTGSDEWSRVREQFDLSPDYIHLSALYIASHPKPVRDAIEEHRRRLDAEPTVYLNQQNRRRQREVREAAASYLSVAADEIALTDSTTMGLGLVYNGLQLLPGQEALTTEHDYYVTHEALRTAAARTGAILRQVRLYQESQNASVDEIVGNLMRAVAPQTRVVALTWVHSGNGLKLPLAEISGALAEINSGRDERDQALLCVDGVHGFGVEDVTMRDLGCDFFIAGCHKWLFGPRGTGIVCGKPQAWARARPIIPSFTDDEVWSAWLAGGEPEGPVTAIRMTPGGFKAFEHQWAVAQAFEFHRRIGKARIAARTRELAQRLKDGLAGMAHVKLYTPRDERLSAGVVCFDVDGMSPQAVVSRLRRRRIVATTAPYATPHARFAPCIYNTPEEIDRVLQEVRELA